MADEINEPVTLSGGEAGGSVVEGEGWAIGTEQVHAGLRYRRDTADLAIYTGPA